MFNFLKNNFSLAEAYARLSDHENALLHYQTLLDWKQAKLGRSDNEEIASLKFNIAFNMNEIGKKEESLRIYHEVYGTFFNNYIIKRNERKFQ